MKKVLSSLFALLLIAVVAFGTVSCGGKKENDVVFMVDGAVYHTVTTMGDEKLEMPSAPTKDGYTFDGWYRDEGTWKESFGESSLVGMELDRKSVV